MTGNHSVMNRELKQVRGSSCSKLQDCNVCIKGKMIQSRNKNPDAHTTKPLELVHTDLAGPIDPASREDFRYSIAFTDDYSRAIFVYFLKNKSDTVAKCIRLDNGGEFISKGFESREK